MVQILTPQSRQKPSFLQSIAGGLAEGTSKAVPEYFQKKRENELLKGDLERQKELLSFQSQLRTDERKNERQFEIDQLKAAAKAKSELPTFGKNDSSIRNPAEGIPQESSVKSKTNLQKQPVLNPDQVRQLGEQRAQQLLQNGIPTDPETEIAKINQENQQNLSHNEVIEAQEEREKSKQQRYIQKGVNAVQKYSTLQLPEVYTLFEKKGEDLYQSGLSEAEVSTELANDAKSLANTISNVKNSRGPNRIQNKLYRTATGQSKSDEKYQQGLKDKIQPLLDQGLNDLARNLLSEIGNAPEEVENIVSSLGEVAKKELSQFKIHKDLKLKEKGTLGEEYSPENLQKVYSSVGDILQKDPSVNLILLRKAYENKGVDWDTFREAIGNSIASGAVKFSSQQLDQLDKLDEPPLAGLDYILNKLNIIGR